MANNTASPYTVTAGELYADLLRSASQRPDYHAAYRLMDGALQRLLADTTNVAGARFNGTFAKTDYLLKHYNAPKALRQQVNAARTRLRKSSATTDEKLGKTYAHDIKAVALLVELVSREAVPAELARLFAHGETVGQQATLRADYVRLVVNRWDDRFIYATADSEDGTELRVHYGGASEKAVYADWDWSYLRELLNERCQLNIVRPREVEGTLYPELFIFEPDYLVDISAVAACFENYGRSPLNHLLAQLRPQQATPATLLGQMASQLLDEALYSTPGSVPYKETATRFFHENAVRLLTTDAGADFHAKAMAQRDIIYQTLRTTLPTLLQGEDIRFDADDIMVEPSFFSEMLGLQGRMDFLQLDHRVLIEQKSGKGGFPQRDADTPTYQEKHYVQLLLYMLLIRYNYRQTYEQNNRALHAFLLYSRYRNALLPLGFAPSLVFAAIKLRNEITASEYAYSSDGLDVLCSLTADSLNEKGVGGKLWEQYQKPEIEALLHPVSAASPLERAYYLRMMRFLHTEHLMAKVGGHTKENSGFADKWLSTLEEKQQAGTIYSGLKMVSPEREQKERVERVVLRFADGTSHETSNFRTGDIVVLYPYDGGEPDVRRTMVFRASIENISTDSIVLSLRAAQACGSAFWHGGEHLWAIEHDMFDSSHAALYRAMHAFLSAPQERRDLLLLQRDPRCDKSLALRGDYGTFNELALKVRQASDLFLIIGPPGTGKTSFGLLTTLQEHLLATDDNVLLMAYTNRAVDEFCTKLSEAGIDFIRISGRFACDEAHRQQLLDSMAAECDTIEQLRRKVDSTRVFVGTTTAFNANSTLLAEKGFGLAIIDEASQILEPHLMGLLSLTKASGECAIRKMVLIGDHKQLPAVVQQTAAESTVSEQELRDIMLDDCRQSLFQRLLRRYRHNSDVTYMLTRQGRMHHDIALFPNHAFYGDRLTEVPLAHQREPLAATAENADGIDQMITSRRMAFVAIEPQQPSQSDKVNTAEAQAIAATVAHIYHAEKNGFEPQKTIGIIVPYRNQIAEVRRWIASYGIVQLNDITIDTIERYQGSQRDYIIYGFTVQRTYQLRFLTDNVFQEDGQTIDRRLNVAMTRARRHLLLFGNPRLLGNNATFALLMQFAREQNAYVSAPLDDFINGRFTLTA